MRTTLFSILFAALVAMVAARDATLNVQLPAGETVPGFCNNWATACAFQAKKAKLPHVVAKVCGAAPNNQVRVDCLAESKKGKVKDLTKAVIKYTHLKTA